MFLRVAWFTSALLVAMCAGAPSPQSDAGLASALNAAGADQKDYSCECNEQPSKDNILTLYCHCAKKQGPIGAIEPKAAATCANASTPGRQCYNNPTDFATACKNTLGGIVDGARCFFHTSSHAADQTWSSAWESCTKSGGQVAQIHTDSEYDKILQYLKTGHVVSNGKEVRVAAKNSPSANLHDNCMIDLKNTFWYDSESGSNPKLSAGNTWLRKHECGVDKSPNPLPSCINIFYADPISGSSFGDNSCDTQVDALCQYNNGVQEFNKTEFCLTEEPVETLTTSDPVECATLCTKRGWCRSYNVIGGQGLTCQLFPWSVLDSQGPTAAKRTPATESCVLFNYVP